MKVKYIDLKPHMGDKGMFPELDGVKRAESLRSHGNFRFEKNVNGDYGVFCDGQIINVNRYCDKIHIAGFSFWGAHYGDMKLFFRGTESAETIEAYFSDWFHPYEHCAQGYENELEHENNIAKVLLKYKISGQYTYIYHKTYSFPTARYLETIKLSDNCFVVIQALSVE